MSVAATTASFSAVFLGARAVAVSLIPASMSILPVSHRAQGLGVRLTGLFLAVACREEPEDEPGIDGDQERALPAPRAAVADDEADEDRRDAHRGHLDRAEGEREG